MEQKLFSELRSLFVTTKERPNEIRIRIRMRDKKQTYGGDTEEDGKRM